MAIRQFFTERKHVTVGSSVKLPDTEAEHIRKALRMQPDDEILLFNGEQKFRAKLTLVAKDAVVAEVVETIAVSHDGPKLTLIQGLIRAANMELVLQKVTELGIDNIIPLKTEFSQVDITRLDTKMDRWERIILEACKQSEREHIPQLFQPVTLAELHESKALEEFDITLFCTVPRDLIHKISPVRAISEFVSSIQGAQHIGVIIGPEGGFSPSEHQLARDIGLPFVSLGKNVLKAETAAIAAVGFVRFLN